MGTITLNKYCSKLLSPVMLSKIFLFQKQKRYSYTEIPLTTFIALPLPCVSDTIPSYIIISADSLHLFSFFIFGPIPEQPHLLCRLHAYLIRFLRITFLLRQIKLFLHKFFKTWKTHRNLSSCLYIYNSFFAQFFSWN